MLTRKSDDPSGLQDIQKPHKVYVLPGTKDPVIDPTVNSNIFVQYADFLTKQPTAGVMVNLASLFCGTPTPNSLGYFASLSNFSQCFSTLTGIL